MRSYPPTDEEAGYGRFTEKVKGHTNDAVGEVKQHSGNPETRAEGKDQEAKGEYQKAKGDVE